MSDVERDELTAEQSAASEEQTQQDVGQSEETGEGTLIPEKFLEKSKMDVIRAYQEIERDRGRLASEVGELRKQQEDAQEKYRQLELNRMQQPVQPQTYPQQQAPLPQQQDPLSVLDSKFEDDPKEAIREALQRQSEDLQTQARVQWMQEQQAKFIDSYQTQKRDNPDFARREPAIQQLAQRYGHIIRPEYQNSPDVLQALDLMSRGLDVDYYKKQAVEETQKHRASVLDEKRKAHSESSNSEGDRKVNLDDLSNEEYLKKIEDLYGYADKD